MRTILYILLATSLLSTLSCRRNQPASEPVAPTYTNLLPILPGGNVLLTSEYAEFEIKDEDQFRTLYTHQPNGHMAIASRIDRYRLDNLVVPYMQHMIAANLLCPEAERALLIGAGGGSMIHFLQSYTPKLHLDAIDIDPAIIALSQDLFGIKTNATTRLIEADGFEFIANSTDQHYDIIYLDAFLRPSPTTDHAGIPLELKTLHFYQDLKRILRPSGVVAFNLHASDSLQHDITTIQKAFLHTHVLEVEHSTNRIIIAANQPLQPRSTEIPWLRLISKKLLETPK